MADIELVTKNLTAEMEILKFEISTLSNVFRQTQFFGHSSNFPNAHDGYLMTCMGKFDVQSAYWAGTVGTKGQTARMIAFMDRYLHPNREQEHRMAIQMFRHTLMHTGSLRFIYDRRNDVRFTWRVRFDDELPPQWHYRITTEDERHQDQLLAAPITSASTSSVCKALNVSIPQFAEDLRKMTRSYLADFSTDPVLQANYDAVQSRILIQEFS